LSESFDDLIVKLAVILASTYVGSMLNDKPTMKHQLHYFPKKNNGRSCCKNNLKKYYKMTDIPLKNSNTIKYILMEIDHYRKNQSKHLAGDNYEYRNRVPSGGWSTDYNDQRTLV